MGKMFLYLEKFSGVENMEFVLVYILGGCLYACIELLWRGWTHWTMLLCGGLCFTVMYVISGIELSLIKKCVLSTACICLVEFLTGCIVNLHLKWQVWDYSDLPFNLLGQICPQFLALWLMLSVPGLLFCSALRKIL